MGGVIDYDSVVVLVRAFTGLLFVAAGVSKLPGGARELSKVIRSYEILPPAAASVLARVLPPLEISAGAAFALGLAPRLTGTLLVLLLIGFSGGVALNLLRGRRTIDCGCFGAPRRGISWGIVVRNVVLAAFAAGASLQGDARTALPALLVAGGALGLAAAARSVLSLLRMGGDDIPRPDESASPPTDARLPGVVASRSVERA